MIEYAHAMLFIYSRCLHKHISTQVDALLSVNVLVYKYDSLRYIQYIPNGKDVLWGNGLTRPNWL
jgi:hypothetical protein